MHAQSGVSGLDTFLLKNWMGNIFIEELNTIGAIAHESLIHNYEVHNNNAIGKSITIKIWAIVNHYLFNMTINSNWSRFHFRIPDLQMSSGDLISW